MTRSFNNRTRRFKAAAAFSIAFAVVALLGVTWHASAQEGCPPAVPLNEGFESGTLNTFSTTTVLCQFDDAHSVQANPCGGWYAATGSANTGTYAAHIGDAFYTSDQRLTLNNPIAIPGNVTGASLSFYHHFDFERSGEELRAGSSKAKTQEVSYYDGGILETSIDDGATWQDAEANITTGGYNGTLEDESSNPLSGRDAWVGYSGGSVFSQVQVNLLPYAGHNVLFRFRVGTDGSNGGEPQGWWVDDVNVSLMVPCGPQITNVVGSKVISGGSLVPGGNVIYTINLTNNGNIPQMDNPYYEFVDALPSQLTFISAAATTGTVDYTTVKNGFGWSGAIPAGGTITMTVNANVNPGTTGQTISNQGTIFSDTNGDGINETISYTDDPATPTVGDPTIFRTAETISGNIKQFNGASPATNLSGVTVNVTGTANASATTDASGNYTITGLPNPGTYTVTPSLSGKTFDPMSRTFTNQSGNLAGVNFLAYNSAAVPRQVSIPPTIVRPGDIVDVPVVMNSQGTETSVSFSVSYDTNPFTSTPTAVCGSSDPGCTITINSATPGKIGVTVVNPTPFNAGPREVARIRLQSLPTSLQSTPITFGDAPFTRVITNATSDPLPAVYTSGVVVFSAGVEGDLAGRPTGDGQLLSNDLLIERQIVAGITSPTANTNEFQRADTFPIATRGDGVINISDLVQERRYVAGLDPQWIASGPNGPVQAPLTPLAPPDGGDATSRVASLGSVSAKRGSTVTVPVQLVAEGNEVAMAFTLAFDPSRLSNPRVVLAGGAPQGTELTANIADAGIGRIAVVLDSADAWSGSSATREMVDVTFDVAENAASGSSSVMFTDAITGSLLVDASGQPLAARFVAGTVTVDAATGGVEMSGRVIGPDGEGLRSTQVTLIEPNGMARTTLTSSLGYYRFDQLTPGAVYTIGVVSKKYRFASRSIQLSDNLADVNFTAQE